VSHRIVYYVDSSAYGGTEQILLSLLSGLDRRTWEPVLFHHADPGIRALVSGARDLGVETRTVPRMQGAAAVPAFPAFLGSVRKERPEIFHAHLNWLLSCRFGLAAARAARVPVVLATLQQFLLPPWKRTVYWQQRVAARSVHRYVAVARAVADQLIGSFHVPSDRVEVIHNGIPVERFAGTTDRPRDDGDRRPTVLTVARLDAQKGLGFLLEAIASIPDARLLLAGDGEERAALHERAVRLGVSERIAFLGHRTDVPELLARCDLLVLPSLYEGFPLVVLEAMAAGRPVVATAVGGTPEAVVDGVTGHLVPPGDVTALANAIRSVLSDPVRREAMGSAGRERVTRLFSVETMVEGYRRAYERALGGG
jgi:glycosyltransferase involved in cell wall biosynthesis